MLYEAQLPYALPPGMRMVHQNAYPSIPEVNDDWQNQVGRAEIDENYLIESIQPGTAAAFLRRTQGADSLVKLHRFHGELRIDRSSLFIERPIFDSTDTIETTLIALVDTVERLAPDRSLPPDVSDDGERGEAVALASQAATEA